MNSIIQINAAIIIKLSPVLGLQNLIIKSLSTSYTCDIPIVIKQKIEANKMPTTAPINPPNMESNAPNIGNNYRI